MSAPPLLIEFLHPDGRPVLLSELGLDFLDRNGVPMANAQRPFRVEVEGKQSKAGNTYYSYEHGQVGLPDGLETTIRVAGVALDGQPERLSQSGNPTRESSATIDHAGLRYDIKAFITKGAKPYWIKVHAQKAARSSAQGTAAGGRIV